MSKKFINQEDVINELHQKTDIYKKDLRFIMDSLESVIMDMMLEASADNPTEIRLFHGWKLGAKVLPEREARNPKSGESVVAPARLSPYCHFEQSFKKRLNDM